jgi:hypothetical protein
MPPRSADDDLMPPPPPRMLMWALGTVLLISLAVVLQHTWPQSVLAVTAYKAHLMALGGWGGYWLDRALFPYDRPHQYLEPERVEPLDPPPNPETAFDQIEALQSELQVASQTFGLAMLRRAIVVGACLVCVGLGA